MLASRLPRVSVASRVGIHYPTRTRPFQLDPSWRSAVLWHQIRPFHPTAQKGFEIQPILDIAAGPAHIMLQSLHATGLPWAATIPLLAFTIRLILFGLIEWPTLKQRRQRTVVQPISQARTPLLATKISQQCRKMKVEPAIVDQIIREGRREDIRLIKSRFGLGRSIAPLVLLQVPVYFTVMTAFGRMSGRSGLPTKAANDNAGLVDDGSASELLHTRADDAIASLATASKHPWYDPSFATEGLPWCTDLTGCDPTFTLPIIATVIMAYNLHKRYTTVGLSPIAKFILPASAILPFFFAYLPAAHVLYICSSLAMTTASEHIQMKHMAQDVDGKRNRCKRVLAPFLIK